MFSSIPDQITTHWSLQVTAQIKQASDQVSKKVSKLIVSGAGPLANLIWYVKIKTKAQMMRSIS